MKRSNSASSLFGQLIGSNSQELAATESPEATTASDEILRRSRRGRNTSDLQGEKRRSRSTNRLPKRSITVDSGILDRSIIAALGSLNLNQIVATDDEEIMASVFKTADELEELAKAARRARRRKSRDCDPPRRSKSGISQTSEDNYATDMDDDRSVGSVKSLLGFGKKKKSPEQVPHSTGGRCARKRGSSITRLVGRIRGQNETDNSPRVPSELEISKGDSSSASCDTGRRSTSRVTRDRQRSKRHSHQDDLPLEKAAPKKMENPYAPSFYHDSDDEDDSLVLDENEKLDDYERQIQADVKDMIIVVDSKAPPCA